MLAYALIMVTLIFSAPFPALAAADAAAKKQVNRFSMIDVLVSSIIDGDSIVITENDIEYEIRLWGIDAPEYDQDGADEARNLLYSLIGNKRVTLQVKDRDKYGRLVGVVTKEDININEHLVESGVAWVHVYYCRSEPCRKWYLLEANAREKKVGLWGYEKPVPPWQWKRGKSRSEQEY